METQRIFPVLIFRVPNKSQRDHHFLVLFTQKAIYIYLISVLALVPRPKRISTLRAHPLIHPRMHACTHRKRKLLYTRFFSSRSFSFTRCMQNQNYEFSYFLRRGKSQATLFNYRRACVSNHHHGCCSKDATWAIFPLMHQGDQNKVSLIEQNRKQTGNQASIERQSNVPRSTHTSSQQSKRYSTTSEPT